MSLPASLRRFALLAVLLPQLFVLGLGGGVVVCVAPGGHLQMEAVATACCEGSSIAATPTTENNLIAPERADCGSCSDYRIVPDPKPMRDPGSLQGNHFLQGIAASAVPLPDFLFGSTALDPGESPPDLGPVPIESVHLGSFRLRC